MWNELSSSDDENYDPYDDMANGRIRKCKRGGYISKNWCCRECWIEEREMMKMWNINKQNIFMNNYDSDYSYNYTFINEDPIINLNIDWNNLNLIPPKTKKEIKKQYRLLCLKYHPDKGGNSQDFIKITDSYNNLII